MPLYGLTRFVSNRAALKTGKFEGCTAVVRPTSSRSSVQSQRPAGTLSLGLCSAVRQSGVVDGTFTLRTGTRASKPLSLFYTDAAFNAATHTENTAQRCWPLRAPSLIHSRGRQPPFEPPSSQLWAVWPKSSTLCFWRGAVATRRRTPPPSAAPPRLVVSAVVAMARRKHLARGGVHVRKSDVSLSNAIRRGEIVKEIVDLPDKDQ